MNLNDVKRGHRVKLASICRTEGGEGDVVGKKKGVKKGGERVWNRRHHSAVHALIQYKKKKRGLLCFAFLLSTAK